MEQIDASEVERRIREREDTDEGEVQDLLAGNPGRRALAIHALVATHLRRATDLLGDLAHTESYANAVTIDALRNLTPIADDELAMMEVNKHVGIRLAKEGAFEDSMQHLFLVGDRASVNGLRYDERSRQACRYFADSELDAALVLLASTIANPIAFPQRGSGRRITIFVAALIDEN